MEQKKHNGQNNGKEKDASLSGGKKGQGHAK